MPLTLDDILSAPSDPDELNKHLIGRGLIPSPIEAPPAIAPATIGPLSPVTPAVKPMVPPNPGAPLRKEPQIDMSVMNEEGEAPALAGGTPGMGGGNIVAPMVPPAAPTGKESVAAGMALHPLSAKEEGKRQFHELRPQLTADPGSDEYSHQKLAQMEFDKAHPWGGDISAHPGLLGKIGHIAAKVGNIAGDVLAPGVMANIPGTDINKQIQEADTKRELTERTEAEEKGKTAEAQIKHVAAEDDVNQQKLENTEDKLRNEQQKTLNVHELGLRKQGLKPNPQDQNGPPVPLAREDMSEQEQAVLDLKGAQVAGQTAKTLVDQMKANPDSPQNQAIRARIKVMAQNAGTAAGKLGLDKKKFIADYFGTDEEGNPIAGTQVTPEGKPIGPKIAGKTQGALKDLNKDYVKPANDVEKSFEMMNNAYNDYKTAKAAGKDLPTGAESMLALSTHLATTFGNVKGARVTKDMIEHHLGARSVPDSALVAFQRLSNGDVLSPQQWEAFHKLIGESRKLSWTTAAKEAKRANLPVDFLPKDLQKELGGKAAPAETQVHNGFEYSKGDDGKWHKGKAVQP